MLQQHVAWQLHKLLIGTRSIASHRDIHRSSSVVQLVKLLELMIVTHNIASNRELQRSSSVVQRVKLPCYLADASVGGKDDNGR